MSAHPAQGSLSAKPARVGPEGRIQQLTQLVQLVGRQCAEGRLDDLVRSFLAGGAQPGALLGEAVAYGSAWSWDSFYQAAGGHSGGQGAEGLVGLEGQDC